MNYLIITKHASKRLQQRCIKLDWVYQVIQWGKEQYEKGGYYKYFLGKRQAQIAKKLGLNLRHCLGLTVVLGTKEQGEALVTVYWSTCSAKNSWGRK